MEPLEERVRRVTQEDVAIVPYNPMWPAQFHAEEQHLRACLPCDLLGRIEHFGSTSVAGLSAKPIIDVLVEVTDLEVAKVRIAPVLEAQGYDYFWRPTHGDAGPPFYAWFIKRDINGVRTHHIHMVESTFTDHWNRLLFRDHLRNNAEAARKYEVLKRRLASAFPNDRVGYTHGKSAFINSIMASLR